MKMPSFPYKVTKQGVSVTIGRVKKDGQIFFRVLFREQGKRKQAWRSTFVAAKRAADDAIEAILTGDASALKLSAAERHTYLRAVEFVAPLNIPLDHAAREYAEIRIMLAGKATPAEACRDWLQRHAVELPKIAVAAAVEQMKKQAKTDGKSDLRLKQLANVLDRLVRPGELLNGPDDQTLTGRQHAPLRWLWCDRGARTSPCAVTTAGRFDSPPVESGGQKAEGLEYLWDCAINGMLLAGKSPKK